MECSVSVCPSEALKGTTWHLRAGWAWEGVWAPSGVTFITTHIRERTQIQTHTRTHTTYTHSHVCIKTDVHEGRDIYLSLRLMSHRLWQG